MFSLQQSANSLCFVGEGDDRQNHENTIEAENEGTETETEDEIGVHRQAAMTTVTVWM